MVRFGEFAEAGEVQPARVAANSAFERMFAPGRLTLGVLFPIEAFERDQPTMRDQEQLAQRAQELDFAALWFRDVPLRDPNFGDVGQVYDPWVYLGWIAAHTQEIALATGSIILPLRHPLHTAKAAASVDQLSGGRFLLGVASGDRPIEFPAFGIPFERRDELFRENLRVIRQVLQEDFPEIRSHYGVMNGAADLIPKPRGRLPIFITGNSRQSLEWIAQNSDGWITYPRPLAMQIEIVEQWRRTVERVAPGAFKPFAQSLYVDLSKNPDEPSTPIHLGFRGGRKFLIRFLDALRDAGVNHVILNFKYGKRSAHEVLEEIGEEVLPEFTTSEPEAVAA
jgi:luciferase-type oxidoreductase